MPSNVIVIAELKNNFNNSPIFAAIEQQLFVLETAPKSPVLLMMKQLSYCMVYACLLLLGLWFSLYSLGGAVASCLERSSQDRAVLVRALAGDIAFCS